MRRRARRDPVADGVVAAMDKADTRAVLARQINSLPDEPKTTVTLSDYEGLKLGEISQVLGRSEGSVAEIYRRAVTSLAVAYEDMHEASGQDEEVARSVIGRCAQCTRPLVRLSAPRDGGRPRVYCSNACRQRAYRERSRDAEPVCCGGDAPHDVESDVR